MAVHVRYNSWYISLPSSAKLQREMTKFCVVWRTRTTTINLSYFYLELNGFVAYSVGTSFNMTDTLDSFTFFPGFTLTVAVVHAEVTLYQLQ